MEQLIQQNEELRQFFSAPAIRDVLYPIIKADYLKHLPSNKIIESDIYCLISDKDCVEKAGIHHWNEMTTEKCYEEVISGDHFAFYRYRRHVRIQIVILIKILSGSQNKE